MKKKIGIAILAALLGAASMGAADAATFDRYELKDGSGEFVGTAEAMTMARMQLLHVLVEKSKANPAGYTAATDAVGVVEQDRSFPVGLKFKTRHCITNPYGTPNLEEVIWVYPFEWDENAFSLYTPKRGDSPWPPLEGRYQAKETVERALSVDEAVAFLHGVLEDGYSFSDPKLSYEVKELKERPFGGAAIGEYFRIVRKYDKKDAGIYFVDRDGHHVYRDDRNGQYNVIYDWKAPVDAPAK